MPPGAKKRKALKKKQQQEAIGTSTKDNLHVVYGRESSVGESEASLSAEEKRLLLPGPQAVRTSWLSCCGLFDAMTGSDR
ncbi:hypothetical protein F2Q69_00028315 [Brassica cretica]|uniref:Uncharacterized protein n=1 Tax=Brassica cretica TaxID=69181 RepID=A0A8S9S6H7_BRACR|nr:hypothetical protein F2Q69_00028315 [Brassica cretica]